MTDTVLPASFLPRLWAPLVVPLDAGDAVDHDGLERLVDHLVAHGVTGLWVNGTSGEFHALADDERHAVVRTVVTRAAGRAEVIAQVGDPALRRATDHARAALDNGAGGIAALPPFYLSHTQDELRRYYAAIAEAAARPVVLYDFPLYCKVALAPATVAALAGDGVAAGIKQSGPSLDAFRQVVSATRDAAPAFCCMHGASALAATTLRLGGRGLVCAGANVAPRDYAAIMRHAGNGAWTAADEAQRSANRLWDAMLGCVSRRSPGTAPNVPAMKWVLARQGIIDHDAVRAPLTPLTASEREVLEQAVGPLIDADSGP